MAEGVARAQRQTEPRTERINTARLKMKNPDNFDGKSTTAFNQWWEAVTMFLGFYPDTNDRQKIAWIGTLLTDTALVWHLNRYRELGDHDTWVHYVAAIRAEYHNEREAADAQQKLNQLKYQGSIRAYMTDFRALNNFARTMGESLREKVDMAMPDGILDMRFNQNPEDLVDDEQFLHATYRAGIQVEKKKALRAAKEAMRAGPTPTRGEAKKDDRRQDNRKKEEKRPTTHENQDTRNEARPQGKKGGWGSVSTALQGVPQTEVDVHKKVQDGCWRCGRTGHRTFDCFSFQTVQGTTLPPAPWKAAAVPPPKEGKKRGLDDGAADAPAAKQQKVAAVEIMDIDAGPRLAQRWEDSEDSDF